MPCLQPLLNPRTAFPQRWRPGTPRRLAAGLGMALALTVSACGGSGGNSPMDRFTGQRLAWAACDPTILGVLAAPTEDVRQQLGERLQCATMQAPLDYSDPGRGDVSVALMRVQAGSAAQRRGAIAMNPGGPGMDGSYLALHLYEAFSESNPESAQGARQLRLLDEFDMIGFSPRGTGASTSLVCATPQQLRSVTLGPGGHATPGFWEDHLHNQRTRTQACLKNPLTPHIHTDATARDMDLMRTLLGDEKLNYVGYSYGTWLGAWYASLFPERVGRMLLDSNMDFSSDFDTNVLAQSVAQQRMFDEVLAPYAARHRTTFNLGDNAQAVRDLPGRWSSALQSALQTQLAPTMSPNHADEALSLLTAAQGLDQVLRSLPVGATDPEVHAAVEAYPFNPSHAEQAKLARASARELYAAMGQQPAPTSLLMAPIEAVHWAVICNDTASNPDPVFWHDVSRRYAQQYPLFRGEIDGVSCLDWGGPRVQRPPLSGMADLDVLLVQSRYDALTDTPSALRAFGQLRQAKLVMVENEYLHGVYPYHDHCVDDNVTRYLLGESPAARETTCAGKPLTQDAEAATKQAYPSAYRDPVRAQALLRQYKQAIGLRKPH